MDDALRPLLGRGSRTRWRRLSVLALLCALASQMLLPLAHASASSASAASLVAHAQQEAHGALNAQANAPANHDPASCVTCQSLLHANPAAAPPAVLAASLPELITPHFGSALRAHSAVSRTGHPPRAPPLATL